MSESKVEMSIASKARARLKIMPTLLEPAPSSIRRLFLVGIVICIFTLLMVDLALLHEMSSIFTVRPVEVFSLILTVSFLLISAILLYPFLLLHYRQGILVEEEVERLSMKYHEGLQEFQRLRGEYDSSKLSREEAWRDIVDAMSQDYTDFAYLHMTLLELLQQKKEEIEKIIEQGRQTFEQFKKDSIRKLINATAKEILEDTTYDLSSYEMPVSVCMLAVAFGFIISSLIPFLGIRNIQFGNASINLVWATGGFIGAYLYSLYPFFQRYTRRDLPPRAFLHYGLKVFLGTLAVTIFGNFFLDTFAEASQFAIAAILGSVPFFVMTKAREYVFSKLGWITQLFKRDKSKKRVGNENVSNITGITYDYAERLHEEGVMNIQNLAFTNTEILSKRTMFNKNMVFDWKDEAILRLLTGNVPVERFLNRKENEPEKGKEEELYDALAKVGINNVTMLATRLEYRRSTLEERKNGAEEYIFEPKSNVTSHLVKLLGWEDKEEYKHLLNKICIQGKRMLGEISEPTITAFAFKWEE